MTIEIQRPELEALIRERMKTGTLPGVEDALIETLRGSPLPAAQDAAASNGTPNPTGADLVAAMQASPCKEEIDLEPERARMRVRDTSSDGVIARHQHPLRVAAFQARTAGCRIC